ncbi:MAG TPA: ComF family protein [Actinomycetota bacterium]
MRVLLDLIFPRRCLSCEVPAAFLCSDCDARLPPIPNPCARCSEPGGRGRCCEGLAFDAARAPYRYAGPARDALMSFKLGGERRAARAMAARMAPVAPPADAITFVPSSPKALAQRGFDPAEQLARALAPLLGLPCRRLLRKARETSDQAALGRSARLANLRDVFVAARGPIPQGTILLVDDVMTTGATAHGCARALKVAGTSKLEVLTFARAG